MAELESELVKAQDEFKERMSKRHPSKEIKTWGMSIRLKVKGKGQALVLANQPELIIGRAHRGCQPDVDLEPYQGSQAGVSRQHSRLLRQGDGWFVEDLGSTNGTFVNGVKVAPRQMMIVKNGDIIRCGLMELQFGLE
jgi:pSer/pThr/pTyr-binding forkhead associated (FHA) protein